MKSNGKFLTLAGLFAMIVGCAFAGNQIIPGTGLCDPHIVIHDDRAYLFATDDGSGMTDWWVWSSDDLVNWRHESTVKPQEVFTKWQPRSVEPTNHACWATFGAFKNGHVYWYVSAAPMGVLMADSPAGPWHDPIGHSLIPEGLPGSAYDQDILIDDDGTAYMVYGCWDYYIVRLNADMISLAETPRLAQLNYKFGPYGEGKTDDKPSLHKRNGLYYLSWCSFYATSTNVYGPWTYQGTVLATNTTAPEFLRLDLWYDRHGNFFTWHNQWFYTCNDVSQPNRNGRESVISYVHYRDDGTMAPVRLDKIGVGEYDAVQNIEAEDYFAADGGEIKECPAGGFEVRNLHQGSYLVYPKVKNMVANASVTFQVSAQTGGGTIEVRDAQTNGNILGSCQIPSTQNWNVYQSVTCGLSNAAGTNNICLTFKGDGAELVRVDRFKVASLPSPNILTFPESQTLGGWHERAYVGGVWTDLAPDAKSLISTDVNGDWRGFEQGGAGDATRWLRSPTFTLDGSGDLTIRQVNKGGSTFPVSDSLVPGTKASGGFAGIALRDVSTGNFVLTKSAATSWTTVAFTAAELVPYVGHVLTIDIIGQNTDAFYVNRPITVPGTLGSSSNHVTELVLTSSANPSLPGTSVAFTATVFTNGVTAGDATGNLVFQVDGSPAFTNSVASGSARYTNGTITAGTHTITAIYLGDAHYAFSTKSLAQTITPPVGVTEIDLSLTNGSFAPLASNDLILGNVGVATLTTVSYTGTVTNFTDGVLQAPGSPGTSAQIVMIQNGTVTYNLGNGCNVTGIRSLTAWSNGTRIRPNYSVSYSWDGTNYLPLATVNYAAPSTARGTDVALAITGLTNVVSLQFTFPNSQQNSGVAYSELAVLGTVTPVVKANLSAQLLLPGLTNLVLNLSGLVAGQSYTLQSSPGLSPAVWSNAVPFVATQATAAITNATGTNAMQFFRLKY